MRRSPRRNRGVCRRRFSFKFGPVGLFFGPYIQGKEGMEGALFFLAAKEREETRIERKLKKNFDPVSMRQDYGKPIPPVFAHIGTPRRGLDKRGEID